MTRAKMKLADRSNEPVREQPDLIRVQSLLLDRGGGRELRGPGAFAYLVGVVLGSLRGRRRERSCGVCW